MRDLNTRLRTLAARRWSAVALLAPLFFFPALQASSDEPSGAAVCVIVQGLGGLPEYDENFTDWSNDLEASFRDDMGIRTLRLDGRVVGKAEILRKIDALTNDLPEDTAIWLFLVGHANQREESYRFNIKGPDLSDEDLASLLNTFGRRRTYLVVGTSASGGLSARLTAPNRVIVTATRAPTERYPPLFLSFFLESIESAEADRDKNGKVSLLESYLFTRQQVEQWYAEQGRVQTEHAVLDDRGQAVLGIEKDEDPSAEPSGLLAALAYLSAPPPEEYRSLEARRLAETRRKLERDIEDLKFRKTQMPEADYYGRLEDLLVQLAKINGRIAELEGKP